MTKAYAKVCLVGPTQAGKTALFDAFFNKVLSKRLGDIAPTVGFHMGEFRHDQLRIDLWDTSGNETNKTIAGNTFKQMYKSHLIVLVVDPLNPNFAAQLSALQARIVKHQDRSPSRYLLVAMKSDLITTAEQQALAQQNLAKFKQEFSAYMADAVNTDVLQLSSTDPQMTNVLKAAMYEELKQAFPKVPFTISARLDLLKNQIEKRFFKAHASRIESIDRLKAAIANCHSQEEVKEALINEARFIRTPDADGRLRYGVTIHSPRFKFSRHIGSYEDSSFYQFIKHELATINPRINLAAVSAPHEVEAKDVVSLNR